MTASIPKRHQRSIIPQKRTTQGQFKPKPSRRQADPLNARILKPQAIPTMPTATNGAIGER